MAGPSVTARRPWHERIDPGTHAYIEQLVQSAEARRSDEEIRIVIRVQSQRGTLQAGVQPAMRWGRGGA